MIKFAGQNNETGAPVLGIGLSRENCEKLLSGQPILFHTTAMIGLPLIEVFLMAGEDEEAMARDMMKAGAINPDQIHEDSSLADPHPPKGVQ